MSQIGIFLHEEKRDIFECFLLGRSYSVERRLPWHNKKSSCSNILIKNVISIFQVGIFTYLRHLKVCSSSFLDDERDDCRLLKTGWEFKLILTKHKINLGKGFKSNLIVLKIMKKITNDNQDYKYKTKIPRVYGWSQTKCKLRVIQTIYA